MDTRRATGIERVVLLGYMCSGKSAVGESLARRLGWDFIDFDVEIERREGVPIAETVDRAGEEYLRALESALTEEIAERRGLVLAPGGGWITRPNLLEAIRPGTLAVWLRASAAETVRRLRDDPLPRPLKDHPDPVPLVAEMLDEREALYRRADLTIPTDEREVESVAFEIEQVVRLRRCP
jgi:shikimate kinase